MPTWLLNHTPHIDFLFAQTIYACIYILIMQYQLLILAPPHNPWHYWRSNCITHMQCMLVSGQNLVSGQQTFLTFTRLSTFCRLLLVIFFSHLESNSVPHLSTFHQFVHFPIIFLKLYLQYIIPLYKVLTSFSAVWSSNSYFSPLHTVSTSDNTVAAAC